MSTGCLSQAGRLIILSMFLSACASGGAPAPVEQRAATGARAYTPQPARPIAPQQTTIPGSEQSEVQVTGLGDAAIMNERQVGRVLPADAAAARAEAGLPANSAAPAGSSAQSAVDVEFPVANPAVIALLKRADRDAAAGRQGASAASLERAIKIEPGNAWLWHRLAQTRLRQNRPAEAASIAARSNSLAGDDRVLQARNWRLIADVHHLKGDSAAAQAAQRKAEGLEKGTS